MKFVQELGDQWGLPCTSRDSYKSRCIGQHAATVPSNQIDRCHHHRRASASNKHWTGFDRRTRTTWFRVARASRILHSQSHTCALVMGAMSLTLPGITSLCHGAAQFKKFKSVAHVQPVRLKPTRTLSVACFGTPQVDRKRWLLQARYRFLQRQAGRAPFHYYCDL